ncbi:glycosyltransferase [Paraglaciecola sp.]|uniref:glycosyltransferase n=1 Tax=Paraglaciecola sp. TaxID=1920173 RepID=UPI0030F4455B
MLNLFVTTGTQFPFDRLLQPIENWAENNKKVKVVAQTCASKLTFKNIDAHEFLSPENYKSIIKNSDVIIGHAGMGTIITAHEHGLPVIIMARRFSLDEHRNDHQMATISKFRETTGVYVAEDENGLLEILNNIEQLSPCTNTPPKSRNELTDFLKSEILHKC